MCRLGVDTLVDGSSKTLLLPFQLLHDRRAYSVQIPLSNMADPATAPLVLLKHANLLQRLQHLALHRPAGVVVVRGPRAPVLAASMHLPQPSCAHPLPQIYVASDRGSAHVVPVRIIRRQLFEVAGLHRVHPSRYFKPSRSLQEGGISRYEFLFN